MQIYVVKRDEKLSRLRFQGEKFIARITRKKRKKTSMIFLYKYTDTDIAGSSLKTLMLNTISLSRLTMSAVNILWHISPTKAHNSIQAGHFFPRI